MAKFTAWYAKIIPNAKNVDAILNGNRNWNSATGSDDSNMGVPDGGRSWNSITGSDENSTSRNWNMIVSFS